MARFTQNELKRMLLASGLVAAFGLILFLCTRSAVDPSNFWEPYVVGGRATGIMSMVFGGIWFTLALIHKQTHVFDLDRKLDADKFSIALITIVIVAAALLVILLPRLPTTPISKLPADPKQRSHVLRIERNFKLLVSFAVILSGVAVSSVPSRRFMRH
ncbi:MAG: hypothetical protein O3A51_03310 [Verrucomicrobia bacterium]|nr:hypothetical protein [Verrucomicrobiota bacterium]